MNIIQMIDTNEDFAICIENARETDAPISNIEFMDINIQGADLTSLYFKEVVFTNCSFCSCDFKKTDFIGVNANACDFSNSSFADSYLKNCTIDGGKALGVSFYNGSADNVAVAKSNFKYINMDASKAKNIRLSDVNLSDGNITGCTLKNMALGSVNFTMTSFFKTPLQGIDFTRCFIDGITVSVEELRGAVVTPQQAAELAKIFGLIVK